MQPWKTCYRGADRFGQEALDGVKENAIIYADGTSVYAILCMQMVGGKRDDVTIVSGHGSVDNLKRYQNESVFERDIYVVSAEADYTDFLRERYDFVKSGVLYKAIERVLR